MKTKQGKLRRVLCVIGWVLLGVATAGGLLFLLSRVKNLSLFKGGKRLRLGERIGILLFALLWLFSSLWESIFPPAEIYDFPSSVWVCEETDLVLTVTDNLRLTLEVEYEGELHKAELALDVLSIGYYKVYLRDMGHSSYYYEDVVLNGNYSFSKTCLTLSVEEDRLFGGQYEKLHFYRTDTD